MRPATCEIMVRDQHRQAGIGRALMSAFEHRTATNTATRQTPD
jgi:GNAT superfamily N-acetyltransferase